MATNKNWATEALINPLHEPTPSEETGPGSSFAPTSSSTKPNGIVSVQNTGSSTGTNPFRRHRPAGSQDASPTADRHASPTASRSPTLVSSKNGATSHTRNLSTGSSANNSLRKEAFPTVTESPRRSIDHNSGRPSSAMATAMGSSSRPRRSSSLHEKYPGDPSAHPLDVLKREGRSANRSPHLRKKHHQGSDSIDKLDDAAILGAYHHEGPYDAASLARNNSYTSAPVAALAQTNREALRATPRESISDSLQRHRPLDNVALLPPGMTDDMGRTYQYKEGVEEDIMRDANAPGGAYKRYDGVNYLPEDLKGKGEPSFSIEKQLKDHKRASRNGTAHTNGHSIELPDRSRRTSASPRLSGSTRRSGDHASLDPFHDRNGDDAAAITATATDVNGGSVRGRSPREVETMSRSPSAAATGSGQKYGDWQRGHRRDGSGSGGLDGLKRRIGSLRRKDK